MQINSSLKREKGALAAPGAQNIYQNCLTFFIISLINGISILSIIFYLKCAIMVMGLTVSLNDQIYEILGSPLIDPIACETHRASQAN